MTFEQELKVHAKLIACQIPESKSRLVEYLLKKSSDYTCPNCWMIDGVVAAFRPLPSLQPDDDPQNNLVRCEKCKQETSYRS
jgi:hypothetical protein